MKKVLVAQRENPIVNRLNKTKVEKFPDLAMEREERLKAARKKDQAAKLERVINPSRCNLGCSAKHRHRGRKRPELPKSGKKKNGKRSTHMMSYSRNKIQKMRIIRTVERTSSMTLCRLRLRPSTTSHSFLNTDQRDEVLLMVPYPLIVRTPLKPCENPLFSIGLLLEESSEPRIAKCHPYFQYMRVALTVLHFCANSAQQ